MSEIGHKRRGGDDPPVKAKRGRPKKKPGYDREQNVQQLLDQAVGLFQIPFDDRDERPPEAPSISSVADSMDTSRMRVRKLLITAEFYSSETSRRIQELHGQGHSIPEICEITGFGRAKVHSYLPYKKGIYKLSDPTLNAEQCQQFQRRRKSCENLKENLDEDCCLEHLWEAIQAFAEYNFCTEADEKFRYTIDCDKICFGDITLCRNEIENAFRKARKIERAEGCVCNAAHFDCSGAERLYAIFLRIGACCKST